MRLKDKVAIITGGSRGIGFATAERFLQEGAKVIITASSEENAKKSAARLKELYPDSVVDGISPNLSSLESVRKEFKKVTEKYGCVDILVNNAGVSESTPFTEYTEETYDRVMDLNVKGILAGHPGGQRMYDRQGERSDPFHLVHGQYFRPGQRSGIPHL